MRTTTVNGPLQKAVEEYAKRLNMSVEEITEDALIIWMDSVEKEFLRQFARFNDEEEQVRNTADHMHRNMRRRKEGSSERVVRFVKLPPISLTEGHDIDYITVKPRDQIGVIRDIMRRLQERTPEGFTAHEVIEKAAEKNIPKNEAERLIHEIKRLNEVYAIGENRIHLME